MDVSLIICSRNRSQQLSRCLEAVRCIACEKDWELIIVDNGSLDETAVIAQEFAGTAPFPVTCVFEPRRGLGNAHNAGLAMARGEIIAFTDDDCYPAPDFVSEIWRAFRDPSIGYIWGRILLHDQTDFPVGINESTAPWTFFAGSFVSSGIVQGANMAFRKEVILEIGGFDPLFGPGALFNAEDVEAAARASVQGWKGEYCPGPVVRHHHGRKQPDLPRLLRSYDVGIGAYHMKLLLKCQRPLWFARGVCGVRHRIKWHHRPQAVFWEAWGSVQYAYVYFTRRLRNRTRLASERRSITPSSGESG